MKAKQLAFVGIAAFFRVAALFVGFLGIFTALVPMLMVGLGASAMLLRVMPLYLAAAIVLWAFSKPMASLVVSGLADEPQP